MPSASLIPQQPDWWDYERKITSKWIGSIIRKKLGIKTERGRDGYTVPLAEKDKLARLYEKYGIGRDAAEESAAIAIARIFARWDRNQLRF